MSVVDEMQIMESGEIEVRIIPPDSVSPLLDVLGTYAEGTQARELILRRYIGRIAEVLGVRGEIVGIVHAGQDRYTVVTTGGDYLEFDGSSHKAAVDAIDQVAALVEVLELGERNVLPSTAQGIRKPERCLILNKITGTGRISQDRAFCGRLVPRESTPRVYLPGELNLLPPSRTRTRPEYEAPNVLRRAS